MSRNNFESNYSTLSVMDNQNKELGFKSYFHKRSGTHFMPKGNLPSDDLARNMNKLFGLNI